LIKFSLITVTFNSAATVEDTLRSVCSQDYPLIEYIVVDGGSTDGTLDILERYRHRINVLISGPDKGIYDALNKGISAVTGEVTGILHSDDVFTDSSVISDYAGIFSKNDCEAVYADLYYVDRSDTGKVRRKWVSGAYRDGAFLNGWMPPHPTFFVRTAAYAKYGRFSLGLRTAADYELMLRFIHKERIRICYLPRFTVNMRTGGASNRSIADRIRANLEDRRAWKINGLKPRFYTLILKPMRKISQFINRNTRKTLAF
jgi:glycosyltransferase involved in cell wall biosynthesis